MTNEQPKAPIFEIWRKEDPRYSINKRDNIVIVKPSMNGIFEASFGQVETKNGWSIFTGIEGYEYISANDEWDQDWWWTYAPR